MNGVGKFGHTTEQHLDDLSTENVFENDALAEEIADTATIETLMDTFIKEVEEIFSRTVEVSMEGNPVATYLELMRFGADVLDLAFTLQTELVAQLANRAETIPEQGSQLRKQVLDETLDGKGI